MRNRLSLRRLKLPVGLLAVGVVAGLSLPATVAVAAQHGPQANSQTPLPVRNGSAQDLGAYNPAQTIRLAIGLKAPHKAAEQQFLNAIQDKHSPLFHHYLTVAQWTARFGPSAAAQNAVVSWAKGAGLTVTHLYPNRLVVDLAGQVGTIEKALGVQINTYKLGTKTFFSNNHDAVLPASLSGIVESVEGLSSLQTMFPASPTAGEPAEPGLRGWSRRRQRPARSGQRQPGQAPCGAAGLPRRGQGREGAHHRRRLRPDRHLQLTGL